MNGGPGKYHCTYKGGRVPCLVEFSECGGISGPILMNTPMHLDDLKWYDNDRENDIIPEL